MQEFFDYLRGALQTGRRNSKSGNTEEYVCNFELGGRIVEIAKQKGLLKHLDFILADVFILQVSYWLANLWYSSVFEGSASFSRLYYHHAVILLLCITLSLVAGHPYNGILKRDKYQEIAATTAHTLKMAGADVILLYC